MKYLVLFILTVFFVITSLGSVESLLDISEIEVVSVGATTVTNEVEIGNVVLVTPKSRPDLQRIQLQFFIGPNSTNTWTWSGTIASFTNQVESINVDPDDNGFDGRWEKQ